MPKPVKEKKSAAPSNPTNAANAAAPKKVQRKAVKEAVEKVKTTPIAKREVVYPDLSVKLYLKADDSPLTAALAKEYLQWSDENISDKDYDLVDANGKKVRLFNNFRNRHLKMDNVKTLASEILNRHWKFNGESMIIGKTGITVDCQHRLVAVVFAAQEYAKEPDKWPGWKEEPWIECLIVRGIDESDETVNTINTGVPRTFADVLYRSDYYSKTTNPSDRDKLATICSNAVKRLGHRVAAFKDAFAPKRTHSDLIDFLDSHKRLLDCVKHCFEENAGNKLSKLVSVGYLAGLQYLMASAKSDPTKYHEKDSPSEKALDFSLWDRSCEFFVELAQNVKPMNHLTNALNSLNVGDENGEGKGSVDEKLAVVVKGWIQYVEGKPITAKSLELTYRDVDGVRVLAECPTVGGIDLGSPGEEHESSDNAPDPSEEEIKARAAKEREAKTSAKSGKRKIDIPVGSHVYVSEDGGVWEGTLSESYSAPTGLVAKVEADGTGKVWEVPLDWVSTTDPNA